jgi:predicted Zn-dependent peptidase
MCFKGTHNIHEAREISTVYDKIGAYFNAFTTKEFTTYVVNCQDEYVNHCISVLSDMLINSTFMKKQFLLERNVVIEEAIRDEDDPESKIDDMSDRQVFIGSPFADPIDDLSYHNASALEYDGTIQSYRKFYVPQNMCISIVSNKPFMKIQKILKETFFTKGRQGYPLYNEVFFSPQLQEGIKFDLRKKSGISASYLTITFRTCDYNHIDKYSLCILSEILGGYMSSRMFQLLREKNGVTYKSNCSTTFYKPTGEIQLFAMSDPKKMVKNRDNKGVFLLLIELLNKLYKGGVTRSELAVAKGHIKGTLIDSMQKAKDIAFFNGSEYFIYDCPKLVSYDKVFDTFYDSINQSDILAVIRKYFIKDRMTICMLGEDIPNLEFVKSGASKFYG